MATDSHTTTLDIEKLNQLAVRLRDTAETVRTPSVRIDMNTAADARPGTLTFVSSSPRSPTLCRVRIRRSANC
jgi:hypothetical protein